MCLLLQIFGGGAHFIVSAPQGVITLVTPLHLLLFERLLFRVIYKSLFTEKSLATQKHSSTSINANKIQRKLMVEFIVVGARSLGWVSKEGQS